MITEEGKKRIELVIKYGLFDYYNEFVGNIIISQNQMNDEIKSKIFFFISNNTNWILGFEKYDDNTEGYYYLNTIEDLF